MPLCPCTFKINKEYWGLLVLRIGNMLDTADPFTLIKKYEMDSNYSFVHWPKTLIVAYKRMLLWSDINIIWHAVDDVMKHTFVIVDFSRKMYFFFAWSLSMIGTIVHYLLWRSTLRQQFTESFIDHWFVENSHTIPVYLSKIKLIDFLTVSFRINLNVPTLFRT